MLQDWIQLPTKSEMDVWRDINTPGWRNIEFRVVTDVVVTPLRDSITPKLLIKGQ